MKDWKSNLPAILAQLVNTCGSLKSYAFEELEMDEFEKEDNHSFVDFQFTVREHLGTCFTCYEWKLLEEIEENEDFTCNSCMQSIQENEENEEE